MRLKMTKPRIIFFFMVSSFLLSSNILSENRQKDIENKTKVIMKSFESNDPVRSVEEENVKEQKVIDIITKDNQKVNNQAQPISVEVFEDTSAVLLRSGDSNVLINGVSKSKEKDFVKWLIDKGITQLDAVYLSSDRFYGGISKLSESVKFDSIYVPPYVGEDYLKDLKLEYKDKFINIIGYKAGQTKTFSNMVIKPLGPSTYYKQENPLSSVPILVTYNNVSFVISAELDELGIKDLLSSKVKTLIFTGSSHKYEEDIQPLRLDVLSNNGFKGTTDIENIEIYSLITSSN